MGGISAACGGPRGRLRYLAAASRSGMPLAAAGLPALAGAGAIDASGLHHGDRGAWAWQFYHRVALSRATGWPQPGRVVLGEGRACIQSTRLCVARPRLPPSLPALQQLAATDCCPEEPSERARRHGLHARLDWHHSPCHASQDRRLRRKDRPQAPRLGRRASVHGQFPTIQKGPL